MWRKEPSRDAQTTNCLSVSRDWIFTRHPLGHVCVYRRARSCTRCEHGYVFRDYHDGASQVITCLNCGHTVQVSRIFQSKEIAEPSQRGGTLRRRILEIIGQSYVTPGGDEIPGSYSRHLADQIFHGKPAGDDFLLLKAALAALYTNGLVVYELVDRKNGGSHYPPDAHGDKWWTIAEPVEEDEPPTRETTEPLVEPSMDAGNPFPKQGTLGFWALALLTKPTFTDDGEVVAGASAPLVAHRIFGEDWNFKKQSSVSRALTRLLASGWVERYPRGATYWYEIPLDRVEEVRGRCAASLA